MHPSFWGELIDDKEERNLKPSPEGGDGLHEDVGRSAPAENMGEAAKNRTAACDENRGHGAAGGTEGEGWTMPRDVLGCDRGNSVKSKWNGTGTLGERLRH